MVFNSSDLMSKIFEYLEWGKQFNEDLLSCSVVNSHWFYHVWNVNSVYRIDLEKLVERTLEFKENEESNVTRLWQRLIHTKCLEYCRMDNEISAKVVLNKLSMFRKIETVNVAMESTNRKMLTTIMSRCKERITYCDIRMIDTSDRENRLSPLFLPNVRYLQIGDLYFYRIWTNKCTTLILDWIEYISKDWCQFVIKTCDCSSISNLILNKITFDGESINESILQQFSSKFVNLKRLKIVLPWEVNTNVLAFWQFLNLIVLRNNGQVELTVENVDNDSMIEFNQIIQNKNVTISKLKLGHNLNSNDAMDWIAQRDSLGLNHLVISGNSGTFGQMTKFLKQASFKSTSVVEMDARVNLSDLNDFLGWHLTVAKELLYIVNVFVYLDMYNDDTFVRLFRLLCQNITKLFARQIPIDVKIEFTRNKDDKKKLYNSCLPIYSSNFKGEFLSKYNKPKCKMNHLCLPRVQPWTYFTGGYRILLRATNVQR